MREYRIYTTDEFDKDFKKLDRSIQQQIKNKIDQLELNPHIGKPPGYPFFREKKVQGYRFYYLIYDEYVVVFVIALSNKKDQQKVINAIRHLIPFYKEEIKKKLDLS